VGSIIIVPAMQGFHRKRGEDHFIVRHREHVSLPGISRKTALTDGIGECQTVIGRIEEETVRYNSLFCSASLYNKRTTEAELWGIWVFRPSAK
jgi:hypothetical protein